MTHADLASELTPDERRRLQRLLTPYLRFQQTYRYRPKAFVSECFTWTASEHPHGYQLDIVGGLEQHGRECVRSLRGVGKTTIAAWAVLWFALTRDGWRDWKAFTTAGSWSQLELYLWPEIHKWARRLRWDIIGREAFAPNELLYQKLRLQSGEAAAVASDRPDLMEGAHAESLLYVFDEAKAIPMSTWDAIEGAFSQEGLAAKEAFSLAISTAGAPVGRFYDIQRRKPGLLNWHTSRVTLDMAVAAGQVSPTYGPKRAALWGETSATYKQHVLGEFAADDADGIIPLAWVEAAIERWRVWAAKRQAMLASRQGSLVAGQVEQAGDEWKKPGFVGADIARGGDDRNVYAPLIEDDDGLDVVTEIRRMPLPQDTMTTTGQVVGICAESGAVPVIDVLNMGAAVVDRTRELARDETSAIFGRAVLAFNASKGLKAWRDSSGELSAANLRSAAWWNLRERLDPSSKARPVALPDDDVLIGDVTAVRHRVLSGGVIQVESKDDLRQPKRLGRSTDVGDAVMQVLAHRLVDPIEDWQRQIGENIEHTSLWSFGSGKVVNPAIGSYPE